MSHIRKKVFCDLPLVAAADISISPNAFVLGLLDSKVRTNWHISPMSESFVFVSANGVDVGLAIN
jgi:hypothetical protein